MENVPEKSWKLLTIQKEKLKQKHEQKKHLRKKKHEFLESIHAFSQEGRSLKIITRQKEKSSWCNQEKSSIKWTNEKIAWF